MSRRSCLGVLCVSVLSASFVASFAGCDDLQLPARPDAGVAPVADGGDAATIQTGGALPAYAPPGAIAGEIASAFNTTLATWATLDPTGKVETVGWNLPLTAVAALKSSKFDARLFMRFPPQVGRDTALTGMAYGYMPAGHVPFGVYNNPHLDFHVAFQDLGELATIDCSDPTLPANEIIPMGWGMIPPPDNCYAQMGIHAIFFGAPEFNGQRFTKTAVLVYYQGNGSLKGKGAKLFSWEPKMAVDLLEARQTFEMPIPALPPGTIGRAGPQPTVAKATYDTANDVYIVTVSGWAPAN
jgi:hypothetical protein